MATDETLVQLFREIAIVDDIARAALRAALPATLTETQFGVLNHLRYTRNRQETPADLARLFAIAPPSMTQLLGRLRRAGFLELRPLPRDGRARQVCLTDAGMRCHQTTIDALEPTLLRIAGLVDAEALEALLASTRTFRLALEADNPTAEVPHP